MIKLDPIKIRQGLKLIIIGCYFLYLFIQRIREQRITNSIPFSKIRSLSAGKVRLIGSSKTLNVIKSPFTEVDASFLMISVDQFRINSWMNVESRYFCKSWYLEDKDQQKIMLNPKELQVIAKPTFSKVIFPWNKNKQIEDAVRRIGFNPNLLFGIRKLFRIQEFSISLNEEIEIVGQTTFETDPCNLENLSDLSITNGTISKFYLKQIKRLPSLMTPLILGIIACSSLIIGLLISAGVLHSANSSANVLQIIIISGIVIFGTLYYLLGYNKK